MKNVKNIIMLCHSSATLSNIYLIDLVAKEEHVLRFHLTPRS